MRKLKVLHLSDTQLSGSPIRISRLIEKYSRKYESRHITYHPKFGYREFETDCVGQNMPLVTLAQMIFEWADIIHYHNRWRRQEVFRVLDRSPPHRPSVIQIHSPRWEGEDFDAEANSGIPIAVLAQYHVRQWKELSFIVPNVVDIEAPENKPDPISRIPALPVVSFAPSNTVAAGWNDKGYRIVSPILKRMKLTGQIRYQLIVSQTHKETMARKRMAHIGIDEIVTGSYHLSSLEYLSLGIAPFANLDLRTTAVLKDLTGCTELPWLKASETNFESRLKHVLASEEWVESGQFARKWMEKYWKPSILLGHYERMYEKIVDDFKPSGDAYGPL
jgi:hypothetical protein